MTRPPGYSFSLSVTRLPHAHDLALPSYETAGASGMDLRAALPDQEHLLLSPGKRILVPSGLVLGIPVGFEGQIRPRSGLALRHGITCLNTPGTIDSDYRGELKILLVHLGEEDFVMTRGMRIAQIVFAPVARATLHESDCLPSSDRKGGFGSTGVL